MSKDASKKRLLKDGPATPTTFLPLADAVLPENKEVLYPGTMKLRVDSIEPADSTRQYDKWNTKISVRDMSDGANSDTLYWAKGAASLYNDLGGQQAIGRTYSIEGAWVFKSSKSLHTSIILSSTKAVNAFKAKFTLVIDGANLDDCTALKYFQSSPAASEAYEKIHHTLGVVMAIATTTDDIGTPTYVPQSHTHPHLSRCLLAYSLPALLTISFLCLCQLPCGCR